MIEEGELHIMQDSRDDDTNAHIRLDERTWNRWVVDCYDDKIAQVMLNAGCEEVPTKYDGTCFVMTAQQLILFIAEQSGLVVEFRQRKRRIITEEARLRYKVNLAKARAKIGK